LAAAFSLRRSISDEQAAGNQFQRSRRRKLLRASMMLDRPPFLLPVSLLASGGAVSLHTSKRKPRIARRSNMARLHSDVLPDVLVKHTGLPRPRVTQTIRQLKAGGRIAAGRPFAPPLTARDVARLVLALSARSPSTAVAHEREVGRIRLTEGIGEPTAEAAIIATIVEVRQPSGSSVYGTLDGHGFTALNIIPIPTVRAIACQLIEI
jgi:hypothetical protein